MSVREVPPQKPLSLAAAAAPAAAAVTCRCRSSSHISRYRDCNSLSIPSHRNRLYLQSTTVFDNFPPWPILLLHHLHHHRLFRVQFTPHGSRVSSSDTPDAPTIRSIQVGGQIRISAQTRNPSPIDIITAISLDCGYFRNHLGALTQLASAHPIDTSSSTSLSTLIVINFVASRDSNPQPPLEPFPTEDLTTPLAPAYRDLHNIVAVSSLPLAKTTTCIRQLKPLRS